MKIILLGTGGPRPDTNRNGPAVLLQIGDDNLLFDAGRGATLQLLRAGISPEALHAIFLTHHHFDHIGNLADVILSAWNNSGRAPPPVYGPRGTERIVGLLLSQVYAADIETRLAEAAWEKENLVDVRRAAQAEDVAAGLVHETEAWRVLAEPVDHMHGLGISREAWECLGYRVEAGGKTVAISGDAVQCAGLSRLARGADVLVQCCYLAAAEMEDPNDDPISKHMLACSPQVGGIAAEAGVRKLVLTHIRQKSAAMMERLASDVRRDYSGELILGEDLLVIEV